MEDNQEHLHGEVDDLKEELKHFQQEKERVRAIVGKIGGLPKFRTKLASAIFIIVIVTSVTVSIISGGTLRLLMIELAMVTLSLKIIYLINCQMRVNHFQFWILSSLEWRINEIMKLIKQSRKN